jgi:aromatic ring-opening dioxygenase catalytic subunit (LigB family)
MTKKLPAVYLPHGGGPCFFMDWSPLGPKNTWDRMASWLRALPGSLPAPPEALLVVSAHWEQPVATVTTAEAPPLLFDYFGFPPETYALTWPAPGSPALAERVRRALEASGIPSAGDAARGFDHGVFVPLKVAIPEPRWPTVQLSLVAGLDPAAHIAIGRALAPLREQGVLLIGSGMSYHNMRAFRTPSAHGASARFDAWLGAAVEAEPAARDRQLVSWSEAPAARESHPREEHLLPLMVVAGAAGEDAGRRVFHDEVMGAVVSAFMFGG